MLCTMICISLFACNTRNDQHNATAFDTVLYSAPEEYSSLFLAQDSAEEFNAVKFISNEVARTKNISILDFDYTLSYDTSAILPKSDITVHDYTIEGFSDARVWIDSKTHKVVKYINIPHTLSAFSEKECIDLIKMLIGEKYDLSVYDYKCTTHYYSYSDKSMRSQVVDSFHVCEDNEKLGRYTFYYTKSVHGVKIEDHISLEISDDRFSLDIYDLGCSDDYYQEILKEFTKTDLEYSLKQHFKTNIQDKYSYKDININSYQLFIKNQKPYILAASTVILSENGSISKVYATGIYTISCIQNVQSED